MHDTAMNNAKLFFKTYAGDGRPLLLADIGAQNVNGSLKDVCPDNVNYTGIDFVAGKGVDVVLDAPYKIPFSDAHFDLVTASSCFEHSEMFWVLYLEIMRVLKSSGILYINVPANGPYHQYPVDCWRFYPDSGMALAKYGNRFGMNNIVLESYTSNQISFWNDFVCVILKDRFCLGNYPSRIVDIFSDFTNGRVCRIEKDNSSIRYDQLNETKIPEDQRPFGRRIRKKIKKIILKILPFNS